MFQPNKLFQLTEQNKNMHEVDLLDHNKIRVLPPTPTRLRRPSFYNAEPDKLSPPLLEALIAQKQDGKLGKSALESWVKKIENEYEIYYKHSSEEKENEDDIDA